MLAIETDFWICSSIVICLLNFLKPSSIGLLLSFVLTLFKVMPLQIYNKHGIIFVRIKTIDLLV